MHCSSFAPLVSIHDLALEIQTQLRQGESKADKNYRLASGMSQIKDRKAKRATEKDRVDGLRKQLARRESRLAESSSPIPRTTSGPSGRSCRTLDRVSGGGRGSREGCAVLSRTASAPAMVQGSAVPRLLDVRVPVA